MNNKDSINVNPNQIHIGDIGRIIRSIPKAIVRKVKEKWAKFKSERQTRIDNQKRYKEKRRRYKAERRQNSKIRRFFSYIINSNPKAQQEVYERENKEQQKETTSNQEPSRTASQSSQTSQTQEPVARVVVDPITEPSVQPSAQPAHPVQEPTGNSTVTTPVVGNTQPTASATPTPAPGTVIPLPPIQRPALPSSSQPTLPVDPQQLIDAELARNSQQLYQSDLFKNVTQSLLAAQQAKAETGVDQPLKMVTSTMKQEPQEIFVENVNGQRIQKLGVRVVRISKSDYILVIEGKNGKEVFEAKKVGPKF